MRILGLGLISAAILGFNVAARAADICLDCHEADSDDTSSISFALLPTSTHADFECVDCHAAVDLDDHPGESARHVECAGCHSDVNELYEQGVHFRKLGNGSRAPFCYDCHGIHNVRSHSDPESPSSRLNIPGMCAKCHSTVDEVGLHKLGEQAPYEAYKNSTHGKLILEEGMEGAAVCSDCHKPHRQLRSHDPEAKIFKANIPQTCGQCHEEITAEFQVSVHGVAVKNENFDAPVCTDCHSEHNILSPDEEKSRVYGANISRTTCLDCHKTLGLAADRGFYEGTEYSYRDSYHGAASRAGVVEVANCASCHGVHDILPSTDPQSSIYKDNLPATCGKCHPNASENFAMGSVHHWEGEATSEPAAAWVRLIYIWMIIIVLGGMAAHNGILFGFHLKHRHRTEPDEVEYLRFTRTERWQHWILAFVFIGLVITGFAFRFPESWWSKWWVGSSEGFLVRDFLHRMFGAVFGVLMLYHMAYMWFSRRGRIVLRNLWPTLGDITGAWQNLAYHLGWSKKRMQVPGLFDYAEKAEYWALVWGSWVMLLSGIPMWFENWALGLMPIWLLDVFRTVHFFEAILASAAIVIWHFYFVIFDPENYPLNMSMITGKAHPRPGFRMDALSDKNEPEPKQDKQANPEEETNATT
jgi:cytochrome b subunit of formate dehydrogenase